MTLVDGLERGSRYTLSPLVDRVLAHDNLLRAWERVRGNAQARGVPGPAIRKYGSDVIARLTALESAVRSGDYQPGVLRPVEIPKSSGGSRTLEIPSVADRVLERALSQVLAVELDPEFSPLCSAYRPGMGVDDAIAHIVDAREDGDRWIIRTDIKDCFDSLDHDRLVDELRRRMDDPWLIDLVRSLLSRPSGREGFSKRKHRGVPQGAPLSPLLTNLFLSRFDRAMCAQGLSAVRYADDVAIPVRTEREGEHGLRVVRREVERIGLSLNDAKTSITSFEDGFSFLGVEIDGQFPDNNVPRLDRDVARTVYIAARGASAGARNGSLWFRAGERSLEIPLKSVGQIVTFGPIGISGWLRSEAMYRGIDVVHLSMRGNYLGRLDSARTGRPELIRRQYALQADDPLRLNVARSMAAGKLANQRALLMRRARSGADDLGRRIDSLESLRRKVLRARSIDQLRGYEGTGARDYFGGLAGLLSPDLGFEGRKRRPPPDPVNAALSFGYAVLLSSVIGACRIAGLDPHVGFLHAERRGKPALALDLMEEFRSTVVDTVVVECFRRRILTQQCFSTREGASRFSDEGKRAFVAALETRLLTVFAHIPSGVRMSYRKAMTFQARQIAQILVEERSGYEPVRWR